MKKTIQSLFLLCIVNVLTAQVSITNSVFLQVGDELFNANDNAPAGIIITAPGENQVWNYSSLAVNTLDTIIVKDANMGSAAASFPNADLLINMMGGEGYVDVTANEMNLLGIYGDAAGLGFNVLVKYSVPQLLLRTPLDYGDIDNPQASFSVRLDGSIIPAGTIPVDVDSVRIDYASSRRDTVDAWGSLTTPFGTFNVLRQKQVDYTDTKLFVKVALIPGFPAQWIEPSTLGVDVSQFAGPDTTYNYVFISPTEKGAIATITTDQLDNVTRAQFKSNNVSVSVLDFHYDKNWSVSAYPNPAFQNFNVNTRGLNGKHKLVIYNIVGKEVINKTFNLRNGGTMVVDVSGLSKGTYLYSVVDGSGKTLTTKRFMVIKP